MILFENIVDEFEGMNPISDYPYKDQLYWFGKDTNWYVPIRENQTEIVVYRAVAINTGATTINNGEYVTPSLPYAKLHGRSNLGGEKFRILKKTVQFTELYPADGPVEFWYVKK